MLAIVVSFGVTPIAAYAHGIDLFAHVVDDEIHGKVTYSDGGPVRNVAIDVSWDLMDSTHESEVKSVVVQTNDEGTFVFKPIVNAEHLLVCDTADGHRAAYSVVFGGDASVDIDASVQRQLGALQEQLHAYEQQTRLRDVLGGIGYILGLAGIVALIKTRRRST
jgi:nickel transport protein